ncbi:hypothetical protein COO60DRAFT_1702205 [Scenedesmus sp. NREL 46B-D3]|nr:hypothetical protein COO60DRAFT_1702205 [Scenedesmus sp. NREL 46B-D3]
MDGQPAPDGSLQGVVQPAAEQIQPEDAMMQESVMENPSLKRAAPDDVADAGQPEAKQPRLEGAAAECASRGSNGSSGAGASRGRCSSGGSGTGSSSTVAGTSCSSSTGAGRSSSAGQAQGTAVAAAVPAAVDPQQELKQEVAPPQQQEQPAAAVPVQQQQQQQEAGVAPAPDAAVSAAPAAAAADGAAPAPAAAAPADSQQQQQQQDAQQRGRGSGGGGHPRGERRASNPAPHAEGAVMAGQEPRGDAAKFKLPADAVLKQEIPLQRRMASCVIGIKGQSVAKLRRESGAKIHVRPGQGPGELDQVVEVEGSIEAVSGAAVSGTAGQCRAEQSKEEGGGRGGREGAWLVLLCIRMIDDLLRSEDPKYTMVPKADVTSRFYVLPEMIGPAIIGKAGTHAKHIRERTGVRIEVVGPGEGSNRQQIILHGTAERTREAYHLLLGNIRKYAPNLAPGAVPAPLPFPHRPVSGAGGGGRGGGRHGDRPSPSSREGNRGYGGSRGGGAGAPPPPPPRGGGGGRGYRGYDDYAAPPDPYRAHDPYARAAPAAAPYATAQAPYSTAADPAAAAAAAAAASAQALSAAAQQPQMMYILQDGVLKPLAVTYQQAVPGAMPGSSNVVPGIAGYAPTPAAAAAPTSTGGTTVLYQQAGTAAGATYAYAAPAQQAGGVASADASGGAAPSWMGAVQQLMAGQVAASSAPLAVGAYPAGAPAATYSTGAGQTGQYSVPAGTQYVQYANYPPQ